jgi:hypothetical protein
MSRSTDKFLAQKRVYDIATEVVVKNLSEVWKAVAALSLYGGGGADPPWQWVVVAGNKVDEFPSHLKEVGFEISTDELPDWITIGKILADWHRADEKYRETWNRLPPEEKHSLQEHEPPPRKQPPMSTSRGGVG